MKLSKKIILSAVAAGSLCGLAASAQTFTYNPGDLFVAFRTTTSANDLVVDIGSYSTYQAAGGTFTISGVTGSELTSVFGSLDGLYWSVFGFTSGNNNLFTTSARGDITTQTDPTPSASQQRPRTGCQQNERDSRRCVEFELCGFPVQQ